LLRKRFASVESYRLAAGVAIKRQVEEGFLLPADAETLRRETVDAVSF